MIGGSKKNPKVKSISNREKLSTSMDDYCLTFMEMLQSPKSKIGLLSNSSLYGYIFSLSVDEEHSYYLNVKKNRFVSPISEYCIKLCFLTSNQNKNDTEVKFLMNNYKQYIYDEYFLKEARIQQNAWLRSISGGRNAITPSIVDFFILNIESGAKLMDTIIKNMETNVEKKYEKYLLELKQILSYQYEVILGKSKNINFSIGILVMPLIEKSVTLYSASDSYFLFDSTSLNISNQEKVLSNAIAQILRLILQVRIFHADLHLNNILCYENMECIIIDFGRSFYIDENDEIYKKIFVNNASYICKRVKEMFDFSLSIKKEEYMIRFVKYFFSLLFKWERKFFVYSSMYVQSVKRPLSWIKVLMYNNSDHIFLNAYKIYYENIITIKSVLTSKVLKKYIKENKIINLNLPKENYFKKYMILEKYNKDSKNSDSNHIIVPNLDNRKHSLKSNSNRDLRETDDISDESLRIFLNDIFNVSV